METRQGPLQIEQKQVSSSSTKSRCRRWPRKPQPVKLEEEEQASKFCKQTISQVEEKITNVSFHNLSSMKITSAQRDLLAYGTKFIPTPSPQSDLLQDFSLYARRIRIRDTFSNTPYVAKFYIPNPNSTFNPVGDAATEARYISPTIARLKSLLPKAENLVSKMLSANISPEQRSFLKLMHNNPDYIIKPADKNLGLTLMDRPKYDAECMRQLLDSNTYSPIADPGTIPVQQIYDELLRVFTKAHKEKLIEDNIIKYIRLKVTPTASKPPGSLAAAQLPHFYILPKVHKPGPLKGRPIVPGHSWITTPASVWLDHVIQPLVKEIPTLISDSTALLNSLSRITLPDSCTLVTADVTSLYTEIPTDEGIRFMKVFLMKNRLPTPYINLIIDVLTIVLKNNYFTFNGLFFHQKKGTAMGTPVAVVYANIYMYMMEFPIIHNNKETCLFYRRLLDDIITITIGDNSVFVAALNKARPTIKLEVTSP